MKRKTICRLLAVVLALTICLGLAACGGTPETPDTPETPETPDTPDVPDTPSAPETPSDPGICTVAALPGTAELKAGESIDLTANVQQNFTAVSDLSSSGLKLWWWADSWNEHEGGNSDADFSNYDENSGNSLTATVTPNSPGTYYIAAELQDAAGNRLAISYAELTVTEAEEEAPEPVTASIYVPFVTKNEDFIRGTDVSSLLTVLNSGARFYDWDGNSLGESVEEQGAGFMKLLREAGVNWIRIRVWNDPYDSQGRGYGGGNNDVPTAAIIGKWATDAGMRVLIDFHYSDFWADPAKQMVPKAWAGMDIDTKAQALHDFTVESLNTLLDAGVDVGMVQVGNETTTGICGETDWTNMGRLFAAGCDAVHETADAHSCQILAAVHFTNPERGNYHGLASRLEENGVNYDVFASSYYPEWHGTLDNLYVQLKNIADKYDKLVMVAETSCPYTYEDGDGNGAQADPNGYPVSVQGQATEFAAVAKTVRSIGEKGLGLFYWENAWIPVRNINGVTGSAWDDAYAENQRIWEEFGSGWASSYAGEYDPDDAGKWYGGPAMDNKAMFDFDGRPLESLNVFKYMLTGTTGYANEISQVPALAVEALLGGELELQSTVGIVYTDGTEAELPITWDEAAVAAVDMNALGEKFTVTGTVSDGTYSAPVTCEVSVVKENFIVNGDFEDGNTGYTTENWKGKGVTDKEASNAVSGTWVLHFWAESAIENGRAYQTVKLAPGNYRFSVYGQGGSMGDGTALIFVGDTTEPLPLTAYGEIHNAVIEFTVSEESDVEVGVILNAPSGAWGAFDDWTLYKLD